MLGEKSYSGAEDLCTCYAWLDIMSKSRQKSGPLQSRLTGERDKEE